VFPIRDLNPTRLFPIVTLALIAANVAVFLLWQPASGTENEVRFLYENAAIACEVTTNQPLSAFEIQSGRCVEGSNDDVIFPDKQVRASVLVSMFLHGGPLHLLGNMWFLWLFGNNVEEAYGRLRYLATYIAAGIAATLAFVLLRPHETTPLVGASGAIAGVLGAYLVLFPNRWVISLVFITLLPVPAALFLGLWFVLQFAVPEAGVAWEAHVAGFIFGAALTALFRAPLLGRVRRLHGRGFST
jgi:membrane associated rhomboid family serine protease